MIFEKQEYQEECVSNIMEALDPADPHSIDIPTLHANLKRIHAEKGIAQTNLVKMRRLDVLMETGTGKTFTYLKTMYEMNKRWGVNKFIIFVPRLAIRAGVLQNIDLTSEHFAREYGTRLKRHTYGEKSGLSQVESYISNEHEFSVLILTGASITASNKTDRILSSPQEDMIYRGKSPLEAIGKMNPVVFIDEPHLLRSDGFTNSYDDYFKDSLLLRFGATFPDEKNDKKLSNVIYTLDSLTAFRENLVKKIGVYTINDGETGIKFYKSDKAGYAVKIHYVQDDQDKFEHIKKGQNISTVTNDPAHDYHIIRIKDEKIYLSNGVAQEFSYTLTDDTIRRMIALTIENHFEKEKRLFDDGIKTLSLFFIPNIKDFKKDDNNPNPRIKRIFEEEYIKQRAEILKTAESDYKKYLERDYNDEGELCVHEGYFSGDKADENEINNKVNLILNAKEKLLSTETSLRFIFSVWALQEGWDNPNIFNICKLTPTNKETSRRQQVGRGLRLSVADGINRQTREKCENDVVFYDRNTLDVVVSGHEYNFIEGLQKEIIGSSLTSDYISEEALNEMGLDDTQRIMFLGLLIGKGAIKADEKESKLWHILSPIDDFLEDNKEEAEAMLGDKYDFVLKKFQEAQSSPVEDKGKKSDFVNIRAERFKEFEALWKIITSKAVLIYSDVDDGQIIANIKEAFDNETIAPLKMQIIKKIYDHDNNEVRTEHVETIGDRDFFATNKYEKFIIDFSKKERLPLQFCRRMFNQLDKEKIQNNPNKAYQFLSREIKDSIHKSVRQSIGYEFNGEIAISTRKVFYEDDACKKPKAKIKAHKVGKRKDKNSNPQDSYLYDKIIYDSRIERDVVINDPSNINKDKITVFAKLPSISIPTPYKEYSPDFAYLIEREGQKSIILVVETKGYDSVENISTKEKNKIEYAEKFFKELGKQTKGFQVEFRKRINKQDLSELLQSIGDSNGG